MRFYTDGSSKSHNNKRQCGFAAIGVHPQTRQEITLMGNLGERSNNQIGGEIEAAIRAIDYCMRNKIENLEIVHDYTGIGNWPTRKWIAKDPDARRLVAWHDKGRKMGVNTTYRWVKGHSGDKDNDIADKLAAEACTLPEEEALNLSIIKFYENK